MAGAQARKKKAAASKKTSGSASHKDSSKNDSSAAGHKSSTDHKSSSQSGEAHVEAISHSSTSQVLPSPPRYDGNRDPDPSAWVEFAGGAPVPRVMPITFDPRNLDLGGGAWAVIRGVSLHLFVAIHLRSSQRKSPLVGSAFIFTHPHSQWLPRLAFSEICIHCLLC